MVFFAEYEGVAGVLNFPNNEEGQRGPAVLFEARHHVDVANLTDGDGSHEVQVLPNLSNVWAKDKHVGHIFALCIPSWAGAVWCSVLVEKVGLGIKPISEKGFLIFIGTLEFHMRATLESSSSLLERKL